MTMHPEPRDGQSPSHLARPARALLRLRRLAVATLAVAAVAGGASFAHGVPGPHGGGHGGPFAMDQRAMDAHIDQMVAQLAAEATPQQRAQVAAIAKKTMAELRPLHAQRGQLHARAHALLMAPVVDRGALEQLRLQHLQQADAASRLIVDAVAEAADVLAPEQRARFAGHLMQLML